MTLRDPGGHIPAMGYELLWTALFILAAILLFSPWMLARFRRFDATNRARIAQERSDRADRLAHFRHTLKLAEEQVEQVSQVTVADARTGMAVTRWLFEGEAFLDENDARRAREEKMHAIALGFYQDLPTALRARKEERLH